MSRRAFRPSVDRLESLCLLDGSSVVVMPPPPPPPSTTPPPVLTAPLPPSTTPPPVMTPPPADPANDPVIVALNAKVAAAMTTAGPSAIGVNVPGMTMADKEAEINAINAERAKFNAAVDKVLADDAIEIEALNAALAETNSVLADLTVEAATQGHADYIINEIPLVFQIGVNISNQINNIRAQDDASVKFRDKVNKDVDQLIMNIRVTNFVMNGMPMGTFYTSDPYAA